MVLMQTSGNLISPHATSSELVDVASFGHKHIASLERCAGCLAGGNIDVLDVLQVNAAVLHIRYPQVWAGFGRHPSVVLAQRQPRLDDRRILESGKCPMLRHIPQPLHAGGLEADVGIEAAGDGAVDDGLLLLLQQLDQLLLGADVTPDPPVRVVEEADDGGLFGEGWEGPRRSS